MQGILDASRHHMAESEDDKKFVKVVKQLTTSALRYIVEGFPVDTPARTQAEYVVAKITDRRMVKVWKCAPLPFVDGVLKCLPLTSANASKIVSAGRALNSLVNWHARLLFADPPDPSRYQEIGNAFVKYVVRKELEHHSLCATPPSKHEMSESGYQNFCRILPLGTFRSFMRKLHIKTANQFVGRVGFDDIAQLCKANRLIELPASLLHNVLDFIANRPKWLKVTDLRGIIEMMLSEEYGSYFYESTERKPLCLLEISAVPAILLKKCLAIAKNYAVYSSLIAGLQVSICVEFEVSQAALNTLVNYFDDEKIQEEISALVEYFDSRRKVCYGDFYVERGLFHRALIPYLKEKKFESVDAILEVFFLNGFSPQEKILVIESYDGIQSLLLACKNSGIRYSLTDYLEFMRALKSIINHEYDLSKVRQLLCSCQSTCEIGMTLEQILKTGHKEFLRKQLLR